MIRATTLLKHILKYTSIPTVSLLTDVPTSTLYKYAKGIYKPSFTPLKKITRIYRRVNYFNLRQAGATRRIAYDYWGKSVKEVNKVMSDIQKTVRSVAKYYEISEDAVYKGMWISNKTYEEVLESP